MIESGLRTFNFSVHSLNPESFLESQEKQDIEWAKRTIKRQREIILEAIRLGAKVKINTVISTDKDIARALEIYEFAKENNLGIRFLNDLSNGSIAINAIDKLIQENIIAEKFKERIIIGSSSKTSYYRDDSGYEFGVKEIADSKLKALCDGCKSRCTEQFYGIRLEKRKGVYYVRLCIDRCDEKSFMPLEEFLKSKQLEEILKVLNN